MTSGKELLSDPQREVIEAVPPLDRHQLFSPYDLLIGRLTLMVPDLFTAIRGIACFDLHPSWMHVASQPVPYPQLNPYGANLAQRLDQILREESSRKQFESLLRMVVPWLGNLAVWRQPDHSFLLTGEEQFTVKAAQVPMESYTLSDGTLYAMALIDALHFEDFPMKLLEEPERYLHPALFPVLVEWMDEVTELRSSS
ncbi:MAG: AAA family ATPase [Firmicutes bacterium]|nr:AAA family ATPase [Bacillota bacterium]